MSQPTIRDVARAAGVSKSTVSNVIREAGRTTPETRERVLEAIATVGYRPNAIARSLAYAPYADLLWWETSEPNLCEDLIDHLVRNVEDDGHSYRHTCALHPSGACVEDRYNGPSHVRQLLTNQSLTLDIQGGQMTLGRWQDVAFFELDGPRKSRQIFVKLMPDAE